MRIRLNEQGLARVLVSPYLVFTLIFFLIPLIWAVILSLSDRNLLSPNFNIVGLDNYIKMLSSTRIHSILFNSYKYMLILLPMVLISSFIIALTIFHLPERVKPMFSIAFFLPYIASGVVMSLVVKGLLGYDSSLNVFLRDVFNVSIDIKQSPLLATIVICIMVSYKMSGYYGLIILSALEGIEKSIHDACQLDGIEGIKKFFYITLPLIYPALYTIVVFIVGLVFGLFTEPYQLTAGGPDMATHTFQMEIVNLVFSKGRAGYGAAVAIVNAIFIFVTLYSVKLLLEKWGKKFGW